MKQSIKRLVEIGKIKSGDSKYFVYSSIVTLALAFVLTGAYQVYSATVTLSANVQTSFSLIATQDTQDQFPSVNPGTVVYSTTTLDALTNDTSGWNVTLYGSNKSTGHNNLQTSGDANEITDQTEWVPNAATTTAGNATTTAHFANSGNVLAFRVMTASSSNGAPFVSTAWWGANDSAGTALWGGVSSTTVQRQIGNAGSGSYSASDHLNTVVFYLNVAASQPTGTYTGNVVFTGTGN